MRYLGIWQEARDFSGRSLAKKKLTPLVLSTLGVKGQKILRIVPDFDHHLTTTEIFSNAQIRISIPVHFAFLIAISDIRKPPKEPFLWRFWCARLDSNQRPTESELSDRQRRNPEFVGGFRYIPQIQRPFAKTVEALGTPGLPRFFWFWENSSQTVVRGRTEREKHAAMKGSFYSNKSLFWTLGFIRDRHTQFSLSHQWLY